MAQARRQARPVLLGGLIAGSIDVGMACLINRLPPILILQAIASGVLGKSAFRFGLRAAVLGLVLQLAISVFIAVIFAAVAQRLTLLKRRWLASGLACGVVVYFVMNFIVVPLSAAPFETTLKLPKSVEDLFAMLLFGIIIAYCGRRSVPDKADSSEPIPQRTT